MAVIVADVVHPSCPQLNSSRIVGRLKSGDLVSYGQVENSRCLILKGEFMAGHIRRAVTEVSYSVW